ncbi:hypothetical protein F5B19DRAFT_413150 [Rostrohypoxylon terebratum]|nr:hypothetical protein F5B19DRAFT_413150 [Rostrohypoxylon terebratum]
MSHFISIVAVHGLNPMGRENHAQETWTKGGKIWLKDFLPGKLEQAARIMLFSYNASPAMRSSSVNLNDHARNLLSFLKIQRRQAPERPLVFICHSLGGLVAKQALVEAKLNDMHKSTLEAACLLVFFATPHQGGNGAGLGQVIADIISLSLGNISNDLLKALKRNSPDAVNRFEQACHLPSKCLIVNFFEGKPQGRFGIIVSKQSATLNLSGDRELQMGLDDQDHSSICKYDQLSACAEVVGIIAEQITRAIGTFHNSHPVDTEKDNQCMIKLRVTDPRHDKARIQREKGGLFADSYIWVFENDTFKQWRKSSEGRLLWIKGDPGKGKTMLLCGIIDQLDPDGRNSPRTSTYFFFQATDPRINTARSALRSLIYLLVRNQPSLASHVRESLKQADGRLFTDTNAWQALSDLFDNILNDPSLKIDYIIIDALDECIEGQDLLLDFIVQRSASLSRVKWIVSSRNWPGIENHLDTATHKVKLHLELNQESIAAAVNAYILYKVDQLSTKQGYDEATKEKVSKHLLYNANDTFLWVALVCKSLENVSRRHVFGRLKMFPSGLDSLYQRMLEQIHDLDDASLCKQILSVVLIVYRPVKLEELRALVDIPDGYNNNDLEEVIGLCGSFLSLRERTIFFIHQSAKEFLLGDGSNQVFPSGQEEIHFGIFCRSLAVMDQTLKRDIYGIGTSTIRIWDVKKPEPDPLAKLYYSLVHCISHLCASRSEMNTKYQASIQDGGLVHTFLRKKFLNWLEAFAICRIDSLEDSIDGLVNLLGSIQDKRNISQLEGFVRDAKKFIRSHRRDMDFPLSVYDSGLIFTPSKSLIAKEFAEGTLDWIQLKPNLGRRWIKSRYIASIIFSPDGSLVASGSNNVRLLGFSSDNQVLASGSRDCTVRLWCTKSGKLKITLNCCINLKKPGKLLVDGKVVASGSQGSAMQLNSHLSDDSLISSVAFSPDCETVAAGSDSGAIWLWSARTGILQWTLKAHTKCILSMVFSPDSTTLASGSSDGAIQLRSAKTGKLQSKLTDHADLILSVEFSPDGTTVASGSLDGIVRLWSVETGGCLQVVDDSEASTMLGKTVYFDRDGQFISTTAQRALNPSVNVGHDNWITLNGNRFLSLPIRYTITSVDVFGPNMAIGCWGGEVLIIRFDIDILRQRIGGVFIGESVRI